MKKEYKKSERKKNDKNSYEYETIHGLFSFPLLSFDWKGNQKEIPKTISSSFKFHVCKKKETVWQSKTTNKCATKIHFFRYILTYRYACTHTHVDKSTHTKK